MLPGEVDESEDGVKSGDEHNERNKNNRGNSRKVEVLVSKQTDLEE